MHYQSRPETIVAIADKIGQTIENVCGAFCVICFALMTTTALLGVFFRYVMQSPFMWTEEVSRYLLVWMGFTAVSIALRQDRHIKVEVLPKLLPVVLVVFDCWLPSHQMAGVPPGIVLPNSDVPCGLNSLKNPAPSFRKIRDGT